MSGPVLTCFANGFPKFVCRSGFLNEEPGSFQQPTGDFGLAKLVENTASFTSLGNEPVRTQYHQVLRYPGVADAECLLQ